MIELLGFTPARIDLIQDGLRPFLRQLKHFETKEIFINGSFVTAKPIPGDIDGYVLARLDEPLSCWLEDTRDDFKKRFHVDFYPALTDWDGMGSKEYFNDLFKATSDNPPKIKGHIVMSDWRKHV